MSKASKVSVRFALLAYSVYCWVDGSARARNNTVSNFDWNTQGGPELSSYEDASTPSRGFKALWEWIRRRGSIMSEEEHSILGKMDVATAFLLFNGIQRLSSPRQSRPILPPTLPHLTDGNQLSWRVLIIATAVLSLVHETQRAATVYYLRRRRCNLTNQIQKDLANMRIGEVVVRGARLALPRNVDEEEEEEECLICSGSAETMSTSSHTVDGDRTLSSLGPLEAFCTIAPQKHLAHRSCFLRWHTAYLQQSHYSLGNSVTLFDDIQSTPHGAPPPRTFEQLFIRASIILQAAGFNYLVPKLKRTGGSDFSPAANGDVQFPSLTLHRTDISHTAAGLLATLRTSAPPCPGCRSPVALQFIDARPPVTPTESEPRPPSTDSNQPQPPQPRLWLLWRVIALLRKLITSNFWRDWRIIVTGQTISSYFGSLLSFMVFLAAITKARENPTLNKNVVFRLATSRMTL